MKYKRCIFKALPNKFEILVMENNMLESLFTQLRFGSKYEVSLMKAIAIELRKRNKNGM